MSEKKFLTPVPLQSVIKKVKKYHTTMNEIADILDGEAQGSPTIDKEHAFLQYYIDKTAIKNLFAISQEPNCEGFVVFFGMEEKDSYNKLTAIIMGADKNQNILNQHKEPYLNDRGVLADPLPVDEQNPPPPYANATRDVMPVNCFTLNSDWDDVEAYFTNIDPHQVLPKLKK